jgi:predicted nucleotidyltransferase
MWMSCRPGGGQANPLLPWSGQRVATVAVLVVLKMAAYLDRPAGRQRDLEDICWVMAGYLEDDCERRFGRRIVDRELEFEQTNAYLLGEDIGAIIQPVHREVVERFLMRVGDPASVEHHQMARVGPASWDGDPAILAGLLSAFREGLGESSLS